MNSALAAGQKWFHRLHVAAIWQLFERLNFSATEWIKCSLFRREPKRLDVGIREHDSASGLGTDLRNRDLLPTALNDRCNQTNAEQNVQLLQDVVTEKSPKCDKESKRKCQPSRFAAGPPNRNQNQKGENEKSNEAMVKCQRQIRIVRSELVEGARLPCPFRCPRPGVRGSCEAQASLAPRARQLMIR